MGKILKILFENKLLGFMKTVAMPRWVILAIDCMIIFFSCGIVFYTKLYALPDSATDNLQSEKWLLVMGVYLILEYVTKNYTYIIRLSIVEDLYRVFILTASSTLILFILNFGFSLIASHPLFGYSTFIFVGFAVMSLMFMERLCIKYLYSIYISARGTRKNIIIFGNSFNSIFFANAMKNELDGKYLPVAILKEGSKSDNRGVNGLFVESYDEKNISEVFSKYDSRTLLCLEENLPQIKDGIADALLNNGIEILSFRYSDKIKGMNRGKSQLMDISSHVRNIQIEDLLGRDTIRTDKCPVKNLIKDSVILVTGGAGSIGSEIVRQVASYGAKKIVLLDQAETPMHDMALEMKSNYPNIDIELFIGDVQNKERARIVFETFHPQYVFHAAAYKHVPMMELNPTEAVLTNVMGTKNIADLSLEYGVKKFVMISTDKAVNPTNIMGTTKRIAEVYVQSLFFNSYHKGGATQFITTRFGNVLGSNGSVIPLFRGQIERGGPITVTHKDIIRYFMTIPEACSLVLEAGCMGNGGEIYVFDMGKPVKIYDLATKMITLAGLKPGVDIAIKETGLRPGEKLYEELLNDKEKTRATVNEKIMICEVPVYNYSNACNNLDVILKFAKHGNVHDMVKAMKEFIPEFKSQNSEFEEIDKEIEDLSSEGDEDLVLKVSGQDTLNTSYI